MSEQNHEPLRQPPAVGVIAGVMLALLAWGIYLAVGGYQAAREQDTAAPLLRSLVIFGCTALFLAFWGGMLLLRKRRIHSRDRNPT